MQLSPRFEQALVYANLMHSGQVRKTTEIPYISHLLAVAGLAMEYGANEDEAIAALLHDVVEDAGGAPRLADVRMRFGEEVAAIVAGCTDTDQMPKPPWQARKEQYIAHLEHASQSILLVSCCDKLHNSRTIVADLCVFGEQTWDKFTTGKTGTLWYYTELAAAFRRLSSNTRLVDELNRTVATMRELAGE